MEEVEVKLTKEQAVWLAIVAKNAAAEREDELIKELAKESGQRIAEAVADYDAAAG